MRSFGIAALSFGISLVLLPGTSNAVSRSVFLGGHFHTFGYFIPAPNLTALSAPKTLPKLADPLEFLRVYTGMPTPVLEYPFLDPPRPERISRPLCTAASVADGSPQPGGPRPACPTSWIFGYSPASP